MIAILAEPGDDAALWLQGALAPLSSMPVRVVTPARLVYARRIVQRMTADSATFLFELGDGEIVESGGLRGLVNRLSAVPSAHFERAEPSDRTYAAAELQAFLLGWLASLTCPLINPPSPGSLSGPWHTARVARHFAVTAGLLCGTDDDAQERAAGPATARFVLDDRVIGPLLPAEDRDAMILFARMWGGRLVQIDTCETAGRSTFVRASSLPHYPSGGVALVRALSQALAP